MTVMRTALLKASAAFGLSLGIALGSGPAAATGVPVGANILNQWNLFDHPDGGAALPTYGLRLDGLLSGIGSKQPGTHDIWTFSFQDKPGDGRNTSPIGNSTVLMTLYEFNGAQNININGTVFGGRRADASGDVDSEDVFGETGPDGWIDSFSGIWELDFTYDTGVSSTANDTPLEVSNPTAELDKLNTGTLTAIAVGGDIAADAVFNLEAESGKHSYAFRYGDDAAGRCGGFPAVLCADRAEGHGWLNHGITPGSEPAGHLYASDFFFTGVQAVPVPAALPLMLTGLAAFGLLSRRRKNVAS